MKCKSFVAPVIGGLVSIAAVATAISLHVRGLRPCTLPAGAPVPLAVPADILTGRLFAGPFRCVRCHRRCQGLCRLHGRKSGAAGLTFSTAGDAKGLASGTLEGAHDATHLAAGTVDGVTDKAVPVVKSVPGTVAGKVDGVEDHVEPVVKSVPGTVAGKVSKVAGKVDGVEDHVEPVVKSVPGKVKAVSPAVPYPRWTAWSTFRPRCRQKRARVPVPRSERRLRAWASASAPR